MKKPDLALRHRILSFPVTTESLAIAKTLKLEGFYSMKTDPRDIARRVEALRRNPIAACRA